MQQPFSQNSYTDQIFMPLKFPNTATDKVTQVIPIRVITIPTFAKSLMEKKPDEYGITLVGLEVTMMYAIEVAMAAGPAMAQAGIFKSCASAIINGSTMAPVTLLLEKKIFISSTATTTIATRITGFQVPKPDNSSQAT